MTTSFSGLALPPAFTAWGFDELDESPPRHADSLLPKYDFRLDARDPNGFVPSTWVDQDKSGDFDPKNKRHPPLPPSKRKRDRPVLTEYELSSQIPKKPKTTTWQSGRYTGQNSLITFKAGSDHGRAVLQAIGSSSDNWPHEAHQQTETNNSDSNHLWSISRDSSNTSLISLTSAQYLLRNRHNSQTDPSADFEHITLGHPSARGCLPCLSLHLPCSLLQEGSSYPCLSCRQDSIECELVLSPLRKATCESCKCRRVVCSYRAEGGDHTRPCVQCEGVGIKCVAGPAAGRTRTGPCLDMDGEGRRKLLVKPPKAIASCVQCREGKRWCSFRGRKDKEPPCKGCSGLQIVCTKEVPTTQQRPSTTMGPPKGPIPVGVTRTITTRLAHPVTFNYVPSTPSPTSSIGEIPCHWHTDPLYGLLGLGTLRVEVLDAQDGSGYTELSGGHATLGHLPSRMCEACTLDRLMVVGCRRHELQPLDDAGVEALGNGEWMEYLVPEKAGETPFEWCHVCPNPANFRCHTKDGTITYGRGDGEDEGCGLRLCDSCATTLVHECDGDLEKMIRKVRDEEGELGVRADVEFLLSEGELFRQICVA